MLPPDQPIDVVLSADRAEAQVSVFDRGIGIGESDAERIFTPFYRSASAKRQASGMGIGRAVCERLVARGNFDVMSRQTRLHVGVSRGVGDRGVVGARKGA